MPSSGQSRTSGDESAESVIPSRADQTDTFLISARGTISPASRASEDFRLSGPKQHLKRPWLAWLLKSSNLDNCATPRKGLVWLLRSGRRPTRPRPVHGGNVRSMITQEGSPSQTRRPPSFDHVLGDARLRDFKPELEQFAVDTWRTPKRIFDAHPPDQCAQFRVHLRSPSPWARLPTPVPAKAGPMPTHQRLGPDDCENLQD